MLDSSTSLWRKHQSLATAIGSKQIGFRFLLPLQSEQKGPYNEEASKVTLATVAEHSATSKNNIVVQGQTSLFYHIPPDAVYHEGVAVGKIIDSIESTSEVRELVLVHHLQMKTIDRHMSLQSM